MNLSGWGGVLTQRKNPSGENGLRGVFFDYGPEEKQCLLQKL